MTRSTLICAGEFYLDLIFFNLPRLPRLGEELKTEDFNFSPGGGAAITAAAAARLGRSVQLLTVWGDSALDRQAARQLSQLGVTTGLARQKQSTTAGLTVSVSTRQDRYFLTFPGPNPLLESYLLSEEAFQQLQAAGHVHLALTPAEWSPFLNLVEQLQQGGVTVSWDLGWNPEAAEAHGFKRLCRTLDVLFLNEMEALRYTRTSEASAALEKLSTELNTVVIKQGAQGAMASTQGRPLISGRPPVVEAIESTGAGDAFNGGFLHHWMNRRPLTECVLGGNICGALSTRTAGGVATLPGVEEFSDYWKRACPADD